jgi:sigma-B regulation protein RsbU (phosphoserine phosphatase)
MATGLQIPGNDETIDLQQQVARLQALLEASRQVHSTIREEEVLEQVLRIVVRELEMAGAMFTGTSLAYGDDVAEDAPGVLRFPLDDRDGKQMTELVVAAPEGRDLTLYESDFLEGLVCRPPWRLKTRAITSATSRLRASSRIWTPRA